MKTHLLSGALRSFALTMALGLGAYAQAPVLITQPIEESNLVTLAGNLRPEANAANDRGAVPDSMRIDHMLMQLKRSPQQEEAAEALVDQLHDPQSPNYHQWLTAAQLGQRFGLAPADLNKITGWLQSHGFQASVYPNGMLLDLSGTAAQVRAAFHTEIHNLSVAGTPHIANMSNPQIPAALAPAVAGIVSLHNFWPHPMYIPRGDYTVGGGFYLVVPGDLAVIYNMNPLFSKGVTGAGQKVVVVEDTNIYSSADWYTFRSTFGLDQYTTGSLVTDNPNSGANNCANPGVNGDDGEAAIDMEYASAAAPGATIEVAACSDTKTTFGGLIAIANILNGSNTPPSIMSMSYGECEALTGASLNAAFNSTFQQAVMEGVSVFVSSGDDAAAGCDRGAEVAIHGIGITGWGGTPYNVAVGGTDFGDSYLGLNTDYWRANNTQYYESAKSYIPEIPWNDTCAGVLASKYVGYPKPYGINGFCNTQIAQDNYLSPAGGSGGPSGCATGAPAIFGVVSGTCKGYAKPSWQKGLIGNPNDGVRDVPDVSLFASDGFWGHYYPYCFSDPFGGASCSGAPDTWAAAGGTSFASPIMAGIQALVNQSTGSAQGNPNYVYYQLAATEYGTSGNASCNSTKGKNAASTCTFYDVTLGDNDVPCLIGVADNCYKPSGLYGVLSTSHSSYKPAYGTTVGWDFATGIGSVNATNLVNNWKSVAP
jgi:subtilase family serine protease